MKPRYRRMLKSLRENAGDGPKEWGVYIVRCSDDSLYTGVAKDVAARLKKHNLGKGAAYTRTRRPVEKVYEELGLTRSEALVREAGIKALPRVKKQELTDAGSSDRISRKNP